MAWVYYPNGQAADVNEVRDEAEHFLKKWNRYEVVRDPQTTDIAVFVMVEPMTVYPGFWQRVSWGMAASQTGTHCNAQAYGDTAYANCYTTPAPAPLMPGQVLRGTILLYDADDLRKWHATGDPNAPMPAPILVALADGHGRKPLIGAGKKLRKMIDEASKQQGK